MNINVYLFKKAVVSVSGMKRRYSVILKKLLEASVFIDGSDYELSVSVKKTKNADFVELGHLNPSHVVFVRSIFIEKKTQKSLLVFNMERWLCSIKKSEIHKDLYENHLANFPSVERKEEEENVYSSESESNWWITINEFINAVQYAVKMKNGLKEIASMNAG